MFSSLFLVFLMLAFCSLNMTIIYSSLCDLADWSIPVFSTVSIVGLPRFHRTLFVTLYFVSHLGYHVIIYFIIYTFGIVSLLSLHNCDSFVFVRAMRNLLGVSSFKIRADIVILPSCFTVLGFIMHAVVYCRHGLQHFFLCAFRLHQLLAQYFNIFIIACFP